MSELLKIQTSISNNYLKSRLFIGFGLALIGLLGLIFSGAFLPEPLMDKWGWIIYFAAFFFITFGLLPYRKIARLQNKPNEIRLTEDDYFEFWSKNERHLLFPIDEINFSEFTENKRNYGIKIHLKQNLPNSINNLSQFYVLANKENEMELTFLYFTKRSYEEFYNSLLINRFE